MTHYDRHYILGTREDLDLRALADTREYLTQAQWDALLTMAGDERYSVHTLNVAFGFVGVSGRPFHAFCRRYRLGDYKDWLRSDQGGAPVEPDAMGFWSVAK